MSTKKIKNKTLRRRKLAFIGMFLAVFIFINKDAKAVTEAECDNLQQNYNNCEGTEENGYCSDAQEAVNYCYDQLYADSSGDSMNMDDMTMTDEWDCSAFPGTHSDGNGNCIDNEDTFAGCTSGREGDVARAAECQKQYGSDESFCDGGTCYNDYADYCRLNPEDAACQGKGVSCQIDSDCQNGYVCNVFGKTCGKSVWDTTTDFLTGSRSTGGTLSESLKTAAGITIPAGSSVNPDGSVVTPTGKTYPAGTVSSSIMDDGSILNMFGSGSDSTLSNVMNTPGGLIYSQGSPLYGGVTAGVAGGAAGGIASAKCGVGFVLVGGVCFPDRSVTGLSDMPISNIIANLFVWLMGIFVTLAIIAFVISGIMYFLSSGDADLAKKAKDNAKNALIGIVIGLSGFIIVNAIAKALAGYSIF